MSRITFVKSQRTARVNTPLVRGESRRDAHGRPLFAHERGPAIPRVHFASAAEGVLRKLAGTELKIKLVSGEVLYGTIITPFDEWTLTVLAWGTSEPRRLRAAEVSFAAVAQVPWGERCRITREQQEKNT